MDLIQYQELAKGTALPTALNDSYLFSGLAGEAGEVNSLHAKAVRDGVPDDFKSKLTKELGDVLWFVAVIAAQHDISLGAVAMKNIDKLTSRKERGVLGGSGDDR